MPRRQLFFWKWVVGVFQVRNARKVFERAVPLGALAGKQELSGLSSLRGLSGWTDSGSLSSGVGSDLSCCDLSCDFPLRSSGSSQFSQLSQLSQREAFSSGDDSETDQPPRAGPGPACCPPAAGAAAAGAGDDDANPVSEDVLRKIRACGTTVTYFGGRVIARSGAGPVRSPMTMAIMEEIRRSARPILPLGLKFRLVKSNSCGSRLELAGQAGLGRWPGPRAERAPPCAPACAEDAPGRTEEQLASVDVVDVSHTPHTPASDEPSGEGLSSEGSPGAVSEGEPSCGLGFHNGTTANSHLAERADARRQSCQAGKTLTPGPHAPGPYGKFGVMEFEEFTFIE